MFLLHREWSEGWKLDRVITWWGERWNSARYYDLGKPYHCMLLQYVSWYHADWTVLTVFVCGITHAHTSMHTYTQYLFNQPFFCNFLTLRWVYRKRIFRGNWSRFVTSQMLNQQCKSAEVKGTQNTGYKHGKYARPCLSCSIRWLLKECTSLSVCRLLDFKVPHVTNILYNM